VFSEYARYYDLLYKDKDYAGEADYVHGLIQRFHPGARSILELGSGTGKHAALLADRGYVVHGVERSEEMLARARTLAEAKKRQTSDWPAPTFSQGDIRTAQVDGTFDAAISLFHVISYQTTNDDLQAAFSTAREHLKEGGVFLFDVWYGPAVLTDRPAVRVKRMADETIEVTRLAEPALHINDNRVDVRYHVFIRNRKTGAVVETRETHPMRYLFRPEVELLATQTGFCIAGAEEWMTGHPPGPTTWGVCFVAIAV
jgi:SAM-dependent methyltransferase